MLKYHTIKRVHKNCTMLVVPTLTISVMQRKSSAKLTHFAVSKDEWNTKEDFMKNIVCRYVKKAPL